MAADGGAPDGQASPGSASIPRSAWLGVGLRMAAFPLLFLVPAGTWHWWEAWAVVSLWLGFGVAVTVHLLRTDPALLRERMKGSPTQEGQKTWDKVLMGLMFAAGLGLYVTPGLDVVRFGWTDRLPLWVELAALAMHLPAFALLAAVLNQNTYLSRVVKIDADRGHHVITTGPYAHVRHPMYSAILVLLFALPLALGSRLALIPAAALAAVLVARTVLEDRTLHEELSGYPEYARVTRYRLVPGLW